MRERFRENVALRESSVEMNPGPMTFCAPRQPREVELERVFGFKPGTVFDGRPA
jgi:hypothetical protein